MLYRLKLFPFHILAFHPPGFRNFHFKPPVPCRPVERSRNAAGFMEAATPLDFAWGTPGCRFSGQVLFYSLRDRTASTKAFRNESQPVILKSKPA
jgi:hypothetical protein